MSVLEFRVALTTEDFESSVRFYRDGLGLDPGELFEDGGKGQLFHTGASTLEVFDEAQAAGVDQIEVGKRVSGQFRFAFEVPDLDQAMQRALEFGAKLVHEAVTTPWGDRNARIQSPNGLQITLFQTAKE